VSHPNTSSPASPLPRVGLYLTWRGIGGGMAYETDLERALTAAFPLHVRNVYPRRALSLPGRRVRQILAALPDPRWDVTVRGFLPALALGIRRPRGRQIVLIHHLDHSAVPHRTVSGRLEALFARSLRRADRLVVVAEHWKRDLSPIAPHLPVTVIHNGFDVDAYDVSDEDRRAFRARHGFDARPLIYLGNCQRAKGVVEAHEALRHAPYQLVTSGRREVELPCPNLELDEPGYRLLLASCDAAVALSRFREGWNRTAHEALLAGTPVVGVRAGGLGELLDGAGQLMVEGSTTLAPAVAAALDRRAELAERGRAFARAFTRQRFAAAWTALIEEEARAGHDRRSPVSDAHV
jgi:glycosyltransferase involved in cell wall biosynthesis